ncbi:acyclic terpene utilization AtuA family protein [Lacrimispora aerotolerans]|uniref:acyclic terpene utilization AtuA family protein n=1 Tax=Lacrimispora aerotolerans TaxID=36832 RepID=UPI00068B96F2|nr:acyclic terpene utilization AtuA family protein [Lacrimispora aerotolerans]
MKQIRIGSGAGYGGDRIEPAIDLIERGNLDYIIFECLAERTISLAQKAKQKNPELGYNELFEYRFDKILDALKDHKVKVITNMGAANPESAAVRCLEMAKEKGFEKLKIAYVKGDDIGDRLGDYLDYPVLETGGSLSEIQGEILSANGYIGIQGIVDALRNGADIIITGRVADPSLALGPLVYEFGWSMEDYDKLGKGTWIGHLLECAGQVTGGYFADPGYKDVPELWNLGFPMIEVDETGNGIITKLPGTGGMVTSETVKEQTLYEIQDPENYFTPDVIADFSKVKIEEAGKDRVRISGASGKAPTGNYKTSVGYHDCYIGEGQISYGGGNAVAKAQLAKEILEKRFEKIGLVYDEIRFDFIGMNSLYGDSISKQLNSGNIAEVRLRVVARVKTIAEAELVGNEVEALYTNGPSGGGGATKNIKDIVSIASIFIPVEDFTISVGYLEADNKNKQESQPSPIYG